MQEGFINVHLRVVGIQFHETVKVAASEATIKGVMDAARQAFPFNYVPSPDGTLYQASYSPETERKSISSGRPYKPGLYLLSDGVVGQNSLTTWQWYHIRKGVQVNQPNGRVEPFSNQSPALQDDDTVIWRLVVVAIHPTIDKKVSSFENKVARVPSKTTNVPS